MIVFRTSLGRFSFYETVCGNCISFKIFVGVEERRDGQELDGDGERAITCCIFRFNFPHGVI